MSMFDGIRHSRVACSCCLTHRGRIVRLFAFAGVTVLFLLAPAQAQFYFGKNKVQYASFDWQVMTTDHFRIYFYPEESEIAGVAARIAEDAYGPLAARFNHEIKSKIPLIIYSSPSYFTQTNVVSQLLPESVGGFTEFLKGRVVVPFHGSYHDFVHVITHELVHVFQLSKLGHVVRRQSRIRYGYPPLWFTEGLAEYWSEDWDTDADMIVKDMVINGQLPSISQFWQVHGSYFMYKVGQSVCKFITEEYGSDKLVLIYENWSKGRTFDNVVEITLGDDIEELSRKWEYWLKKQYFPQIGNLGLPSMESDQLTFDGYSVKGVPINWDDGRGTKEWVVFMAYRMGYPGLYMKPRRNDSHGLRTLVKGERSSRFESLHLLQSGIDATNSGLVVFSSKSKAHDVIYIYDLNQGKVTKQYRADNLIAVRSPRFSHDEKRITFSGIKMSGYSDIYVLDLSTGECRALTNDVYCDIDPVFSTDDNKIVFASDRCAEGLEGATNLYQISLDTTAQIRQLTWGNFKDQTPDVTPHGIYFSSNRGESYNLYLLGNHGEITRQSTYVTGAFDPRLTPDSAHLTYSGYQGKRSQVYQMELLPEPEPAPRALALDTVRWLPTAIDSEISGTSIKYDTDYSFDIAQSVVSYDPIYGSIGGIQAMVSDILGNHVYYFLLTNTADTKDEFLESFNLGVTYVNKEKRCNWGLGVYHLYDEHYNDYDLYYMQRQAGVVGLLSYPISKFNRFDLTTYARYDKKDRRYGLSRHEGFLVSHYLSLVHDNSIWDISGPIEGRRYNLSVGITNSLTMGRNYNRVAFADVRHYIRLGRFSAFANRLFAYSSSGLEPQRIYFGGSWSFRGFEYDDFYNYNILFASNELRFPLVDALLIGFPIGGLSFQGIRGALFFDTGSAWDEDFDQFLGSFGCGFRVSLGYVVLLRFDFSRTTDFETISSSTDFDFFFGWNF